MNKILIVGGTGVISYAVVNEALKQHIDVTCINRGRSKNQKLSGNAHLIIADYHDKNLMKNKLEGLHFDAVIDVLCYSEKDIEYSVNLFKDCVDQYVFFSSCAVYNKGNGDYVCTEESPLINPIWDYSINKVKCEERLKELASSCKLNYTIVRPAVTYGDTRIPYGITPPYGYHGTLIQRILNDKPIITWDKGEAYSTITRVEDFAIGLVGLLGNSRAYNQVYHIVGDERWQWKEVLSTIGDILGKKVSTFDLSKEQYASELPSRKGEILGGRGISQLLDNSKIKNAVPDFCTKISLKEGLMQTIDYYKMHNYIRGIDFSFDAETDRIIRKWCKIKKIDYKQYNLGFVDYLGNASFADKYNYWLEFYKDKTLTRVFIKSLNLFRRLKSFIHN